MAEISVNGGFILVGSFENIKNTSPIDRILESGIVGIGSVHIETDWATLTKDNFLTES